MEVSDKELRVAVKRLNEQIDEVTQLNKLMIGREVRIIELKKEIANLKAKYNIIDTPEV